MAAIVFYPQTGGTITSPVYGDPIPVLDQYALAEQCEANGLDTSWWLPKANRLILRAGEESSEAYLLLEEKWINGATAKENAEAGGPKAAIQGLNKSLYNHKITLLDNYSADNPVVQQGWVFCSAEAIDPDNSADSISTAYLVKFVDLRHLWSTQGAIHWDWVPSTHGWNITDCRRNPDGMDLDPENCSEWPYLEDTVKNKASGLPFFWDELLSFYWYNTQPWSDLPDTYDKPGGSTLFFLSDDLPEGGVYPFQFPLDIRSEADKTWHFFCKLLHCTGNEIFPNADGTWRIEAIDANFGSPTLAEDPVISRFLISETFAEESTNRLPFAMTMTFQNRVFDEEYYPLATSYYTTYPFNSVEGVGTNYPYEALMSAADYAASGCTMATSGDEGQIENVLSMGMTAYWQDGTLGGVPDNFDSLRMFAIDVLSKLLLSRAEPSVNATYGFFMGVEPNPSFEEVHYYISPSGPCTYLRSIDANVGVDSLPPVPEFGRDRKVSADSSDDTPSVLLDKIEDTQTAGTYSAITHQIVWAEPVTHTGGDGTNDNKLRFFTTISAGAPGPAGPAGPAGPTYTDGCGIIIAGTVISFDPTDALGVGMQLSPDPYDATCAISPYPPDLAGCGLEPASDNAATNRVKIKVKPGDLWELGGGIESATDNADDENGPCNLKIAPADLVTDGSGLMQATGNGTVAIGPVKLKIRPSDLCGDGLIVQPGNQDDANGPVKLKVNSDAGPAIKSLDSVELLMDGGNLKVKIHFTEYKIWGVATGLVSAVEATIGTTTCPA